MASITLQNVSKQYGAVAALSNVSIDIRDKEFLVLFGPAGAGKTTLLSVVSGILKPNSGALFFDQHSVDHLAPDERNVAMVFENYALYPHMNVYDNIAFPLRSPLHKKPEETIKEMIDDITEKMNIRHLYQRFPSQISNGQKQRVALGRALVRDPNVFLMDEPLAHLDAKLKNSMRTELKSIQQQLNTTTIYVTHDYLEALSLGDRIAIIDCGKIVQVGTPDEIYYQPKNLFVAKLVGEPEINLFPCCCETDYFQILKTDFKYPISDNARQKLSNIDESQFFAGIRGNDILVAKEPKPGFQDGIVIDFHSIGNKSVVKIQCNHIEFSTLVPSSWDISADMNIYFSVNPEQFLFFETTNGSFITENR